MLWIFSFTISATPHAASSHSPSYSAPSCAFISRTIARVTTGVSGTNSSTRRDSRSRFCAFWERQLQQSESGSRAFKTHVWKGLLMVR